jgi:hypothetical protein
MEPLFEAGDVIFVNPNLSVVPNEFVALAFEGTPLTITLFTVEGSYNPTANAIRKQSAAATMIRINSVKRP